MLFCPYYLIIQYLLLQNPKSQEPVTLDFLDAELENDIKVEVRLPGFLVPVASCISLYNNQKPKNVLDFEWESISLKNSILNLLRQ